MTDEEICTLLDWCYPDADRSKDSLLARIRKVVEEARKQEREACAKVCESLAVLSDSYIVHDGDTCAAAIRNRT